MAFSMLLWPHRQRTVRAGCAGTGSIHNRLHSHAVTPKCCFAQCRVHIVHCAQALLELAVKTSSVANDPHCDNLRMSLDPRTIKGWLHAAYNQVTASCLSPSPRGLRRLCPCSAIGRLRLECVPKGCRRSTLCSRGPPSPVPFPHYLPSI